MSCGNPTTESDALMPRRPKYDKSKMCVKCKNAKGNIVIRHAVYCRECFFPLITYKFKRSLEPFVNPRPDGPRRTALRPSGNLLIGFSGGLGSTVLLDLIHRCYVSPDKSLMTTEGGRDHPRHDRVWQKVTVCYVELCDAFPDMRDKADEIRQLVTQYDGVDFISLRIQDAFDTSWWEACGGTPDLSDIRVNLTNEELLLSLAPYTVTSQDPVLALRSYLASLPTSTALPTVLNTLIRLLLLYTAQKTGSSHLLLGTSLTSLAVSLISGIAQGDGFHIREEIQEEWVPQRIHRLNPTHGSVQDVTKGMDDAQGRIKVIRPLRDVGMKECAAWSWWMGLKVIGRDHRNWPGPKQGIGSLTKQFIVGLEKDYPSTVSTIMRTCGKLAPKGDWSGRQCLSCERPIQQGVQDWKARIAIRSRNTEQEEGEGISSSPPASIAPYLCYACHTTLTSRSSRPTPALYPGQAGLPSPASALPVWTSDRLSGAIGGTGADSISHSLQKQVGSPELYDAIKDFLLED